ncbi:hypothetical protein EZY14_009360 [Kordia sp. TARA_039_SRF]|nr:hypothetical protein EZY14_009360 [Kordia sp. TARA_039_SRF]
MSQKINIISQQTLFDVSIQLTGTIENVFDFAQENSLSITDSLDINTKVVMPNKKFEQNLTKEYYSKNNLKPSTDISFDQVTDLEGIDYWIIEENFIVQGGIGQTSVGEFQIDSNMDTLGDMIVEQSLIIN